MAARNKAAVPPLSNFRRQSVGAAVASARPDKKKTDDMERRMLQAEARAKKAESDNAELRQQISTLTDKVTQLLSKLDAQEKRESRRLQLEDSNEQTRDLFTLAASTTDDSKKREYSLQLAQMLGVAVAPRCAATELNK